jgi:hypothetical protein
MFLEFLSNLTLQTSCKQSCVEIEICGFFYIYSHAGYYIRRVCINLLHCILHLIDNTINKMGADMFLLTKPAGSNSTQRACLQASCGSNHVFRKCSAVRGPRSAFYLSAFYLHPNSSFV